MFQILHTQQAAKEKTSFGNPWSAVFFTIYIVAIPVWPTPFHWKEKNPLCDCLHWNTLNFYSDLDLDDYIDLGLVLAWMSTTYSTTNFSNDCKQAVTFLPFHCWLMFCAFVVWKRCLNWRYAFFVLSNKNLHSFKPFVCFDLHSEC